MPNRRSRKKEAAFLAALRGHGNISEAAKEAKLPRRTVYFWKKTYEDFSEAWEDALYEALDKIEVTVVADAYDVMGSAMKSGDSSMTAALLNHFRWILSRRRPEKWGDREKVELSGPQGGPIQTEQTVHRPDSDDTWAEILRIRESQKKEPEECSNE